MNVTIIIIGNEILSGETLDTNSAFIGQELNKAGYDVVRKITIPDDKTSIINTLNETTGIIIMTGGLGPTSDDITKSTLSEFFNVKLVLNSDVMDSLREYLKHRIPPLATAHVEWTMIPANAKIFMNKLGTAPGLLFETQERTIISLPAVPFEMQDLIVRQVIPYLEKTFPKNNIIHKNIKTIGIPESMIAEKIKDIEMDLPGYIKLAYLPQICEVKLRLTVQGKDRKLLEETINKEVASIKEKLSEYIYGYDDLTINEAIGHLLKEKNSSLSLAESCTGGYLSHFITSVNGSSGYYKGGVVAYSNEIKIKALNVKPQTLEVYGSVSKETVEEMVKGALKNYSSDYAIAITGIAGPDGGTPDKPVGTVWIAVCSKENCITKIFSMDRGRLQNIQYSSKMALNMLRGMILGIDM